VADTRPFPYVPTRAVARQMRTLNCDNGSLHHLADARLFLLSNVPEYSSSATSSGRRRLIALATMIASKAENLKTGPSALRGFAVGLKGTGHVRPAGFPTRSKCGFREIESHQRVCLCITSI
jgi:hypothetical protein